MKNLITSCFGLGRLPAAPGTWGSLPPAIIFALLAFAGASQPVISSVMAVLALTGFVGCLRFAPAVISQTRNCDPREIVIDEFAGQSLTFMFVFALPTYNVLETTIVGFLLFRLFDILKPWPIRKLEKLPNAWGVLADDILAAVYAGTALILCSRTGFVEHLGKTLHAGCPSMNICCAAVLGAVQGLTEFLPVSSSGHLVLLEHWFGLNPDRPEMLLFDLVMHLGTLGAILIVFRRAISAFLKTLFRYRQYGRGPVEIYNKNPAVHFLVLAAAATLTTAVVYKLFKTPLESTRKLPVVAVMWLLTGTLLLITDFRRKTKVRLREFGIAAAVIVGLAQAAAIVPGISRSGATICAAVLIGLRRRWAVEFSFLIAIPAILGGTVIKFLDYGWIASADLPLNCLLIGAAAALAVGVLALKLLIKASKTANLKFFAFYCYTLACFVIIYLLR